MRVSLEMLLGLCLMLNHLKSSTAFRFRPAQTRKLSRSSLQSFNDGYDANTWLDEANRIEYQDNDSQSFSSLADGLGLNISSEITTRAIIPHHLTSSSDLFTNRELNMDTIDAIGFDMDWTLAQYNRDFDLLAYDGAKDKLTSWLGYPSDVLELEYDQEMCRRGCMIDKKRGNVIKLDQHNYVRNAEHGMTPLTREERQQIYRNNYQEMHAFSGKEFVNVDTPFSLVDACLYVQLVDMKDKHDNEYGDASHFKAVSYEQLWKDMRNCVDKCHKDGVIKKTVEADPARYITYDPNVFPMLENFKSSGIKTFLLTNSLWDYTQVVMNYLEGRKQGEDKDFKWTEYFDVILVFGCKPAFLEDDRGSLPLFRVHDNHGKGEIERLENIEVLPETSSEVEAFLAEGKIFQGGNAETLHKLLGTTNRGDRILYVGDHMYSDILRSKRTCGWRTCLIIPELTTEIMKQKRSKRNREKLIQLRMNQFQLESELDRLMSSQEIGDRRRNKQNIENLSHEIARKLTEVSILREKIRNKIDRYNKSYHPRWGPLFKAGWQESRFAKQIYDYSCIYTSRASNLGLVSPQRPFRPVRDVMPHEQYLELRDKGNDDNAVTGEIHEVFDQSED